MYRVMRQRLQTTKSSMSPENVLSQLRRIQHHRIQVDIKAMSGISTISTQQSGLLDSLSISKPIKKRQLSLL